MSAASAVAQAEPAPFLKWAGGKRRLLAQLAPFLPPDARSRPYHEPFLGGGALFFWLRPERAILGDANADLIDVYLAVRDHTEAVLGALARLAARHQAGRYYTARARWNRRRATLAPPERAALFIYLNKTGYNGLWRVNSRGDNNVPVGRYKNPGIYDPAAMRAAAARLRTAELRAAPFESVLDRARAGDFVYLDPPYHPISATANFTAYARGSFGEADQRRLADVCRALDRRGCRFLLSNSDCAFVRELYRGFRIAQVQAARSINSKGGRRGLIPELAVRNGGE